MEIILSLLLFCLALEVRFVGKRTMGPGCGKDRTQPLTVVDRCGRFTSGFR